MRLFVLARLLRMAAFCIVLGACMAGCSAPPKAPGTTAAAATLAEHAGIDTVAPPSSPRPSMAAYLFPGSIDPDARYLFYLHGAIVEDQGLPAVSPIYGEYEYEAILKALEGHGFVVLSEQRPRHTDVTLYARRIAEQIARLREAGARGNLITVVGASEGAAIAAAISSLVQDPRLNFVLLGSCHPSMIDAWKRTGPRLSGNVLAIREASDTEYAGSCEELFELSAGHGLGRHMEIVLHVGTGHGIVYKPLEDWILPTVEWAGQ